MARNWSAEEMLNLAFDAGFDSENAVTIVCIAFAESGGYDGALNYNSPTLGCPLGSTDRGILQINSCYHSEVSNECALDARCSFVEAWRISYGGLEYGEWYAYVYQTHLAFETAVRQALSRKRNAEVEIDP